MLALPADLIKLFDKTKSVVNLCTVEGLENDSGDHGVEEKEQNYN